MYISIIIMYTREKYKSIHTLGSPPNNSNIFGFEKWNCKIFFFIDKISHHKIFL